MLKKSGLKWSLYAGEFPSYRCHSKEELGCQQSEPLLTMQFYLLKPTLLGLEDLQGAKATRGRVTSGIKLQGNAYRLHWDPMYME